ncbi:MAG: S49 family peptidase [Geminicoccaceae bacterium]
MKRLIVGFLAVVGALALVVLVAAIAGGIWFSRQFTAGPELPERIVLTLDLGEPLDETVPSDPLATIGLEQPLELGELVLALERAAADPRVRGLVARLDATDHGMAVAQELRATIDRFRAGGRFARAWADSFGELGPGNEGYYIATAFDEIHLQPGGMVGLTGLLAEIPFVRPLLDRLGIQAEVIRRSDYKTAFDSLVADGLTAAHAEMMNDLLDQTYAALVDGIAASRDLAPGEVERLIDEGPFTGEAALSAGLVDGLASRRGARPGAGGCRRGARRSASPPMRGPSRRMRGRRPPRWRSSWPRGTIQRGTPASRPSSAPTTSPHSSPRHARTTRSTPWCCASTPAAARRSPRRPSAARSSCCASPASRSSSRWAMPRPRAVTGSPWAPRTSWPSRRRSPAPSA